MNKESKYYIQVEEMIKEYDMTNAVITNLELEIEYLKNLQQGYKNTDYSSEVGRTNKVSNPVERAVIQNSNKIRELELIMNEKKLIMEKLDNALNGLEEQEREIIENVYRKRASIKTAAKEMNLSQSAISKLKAIAINKISKAVFL